MRNLTLASSVTQEVTKDEVEASVLFDRWLRGMPRGWPGHVFVTDVSLDGKEITMIQMSIREGWQARQYMMLLRSDTVDVLFVVTDGRWHYVVFVSQFRPAVGCDVLSNVAGGLNGRESVQEAADRELREELGLDDRFDFEFKQLTPRPLLVSPGITNERSYFVVANLVLPTRELVPFIQELQGRRAGLAAHDESTTVKAVRIEDARLTIVGDEHPDVKTLLSLGLAGL